MRPPAGLTAGTATRVATFCLLLAGGVVSLLFAMRLTAAAFSCDFSPFGYLPYRDDHVVQAWLLVAGLAVLAVLAWLVLRHDETMLWLPGADGGTLVRADDLERPAGVAVRRGHPDVVGVDVSLAVRRGVLRGRASVRARPLADAGAVGAAVEEVLRGEIARLTERELDPLRVRVRVLTVPQLKRHLP